MSIQVNELISDPKPMKNKVKPIWCPGCGDFAVLNCLTKAMEAMGLKSYDTAVVSGIGCSSRLPGYMNSFGFNSIHGRALPIATGLKLSRPDITVIAAGGDGDGFAIGGNHVMHAARRNIDITYVMMDNGIYGLTKGQVSPTTPIGYKTKTTAYGAYEKPLKPLDVMLTYGASFMAQGFSANIKGLIDLLQQAIEYPGFSYVNVISPCVTYRGGKEQFQFIRDRILPVPESHDVYNWDTAHALLREAEITEKVLDGVIFKERRETYLETQAELKLVIGHAEAPAAEEIAERYR